MDVEEGQLAAAKQRLERIPEVEVDFTADINREVQNALRQVSAFPIIIGAISLLVSAVVIANSVGLSTMERRREIGVMKALGLRRERVLGMLLLENAVLGFLGGLAGVGLALAGVILFQVFAPGSGEGGLIVPILPALGLMLLCVAVAVVSAVASAWGASSEKPLNVLRYE